MSFPAPPPVGLDTLGQVHDLPVPEHFPIVPERPVASSLARAKQLRRRPLAGCALLGLAAGHRSMAPLVVLALAPPRPGVAIPALSATLAAAELVIDKLPFVPARTGMVPALVRAISGALAGGIAARRAQRSTSVGALIGAAAAIAATELGLRLRLAAEESMPPVLAAVVEDALAVSMALTGFALVHATSETAMTQSAERPAIA